MLCISAYGTASLHIWEDPINAERYIRVLEQHMSPSKGCLFQVRPFIFQQDNATFIPTAWLHSRGVQVMDDLSAVQTFYQSRPRTAEQLESFIRQEWDNIPLPKVQQLVSSVPDVYRC